MSMCKMNNDIRRRGGEIIKHTDADIKNAFQSEMRLFNIEEFEEKRIIIRPHSMWQKGKTMSELNKVENFENLESVAGGNDGYDRIHDLSCFIQRTVCNVVHYDSTSCLTLRKSPNGEIIYGCGWQNGDSILVHGSYSEGNWLFAYQNGKFGYVNGNYVC